MSVNSIFFILFLPLVVWIHFILPKRYQYLWLFAASVFFYLSNDVRFIVGLGFCIITTYAAGLLLGKIKGSGRKWILFSCIVANVIFLFLFRYLLLNSPFVPLGISFYSLQAMGYVIDVFRGETAAEKSMWPFSRRSSPVPFSGAQIYCPRSGWAGLLITEKLIQVYIFCYGDIY